MYHEGKIFVNKGVYNVAKYLMKYKGIYRIKANIDESTNDFPRDENGNIDTDDLYIKCANGSQIYHYGHSTLVAYIPSIGRGHNILKAIGQALLPDIKQYEKTPYDYAGLYTALTKEKTIWDIMENDSEIEFKFKANSLDFIAKYLKPSTYGADISPFSTRNLPKISYTIPDDDLNEYKKITEQIAKEDKLILSHLTRDFMSKILSKNKLYKSISMKVDMRKKMISGKEYIHSMGYWDKYLKFLKESL